jgi:hypothetical protein
VTNPFDSGPPTSSAASIEMSQDGSMVWFANALGNIAMLDTNSGTVVGTFQAAPASQAFPSPVSH